MERTEFRLKPSIKTPSLLQIPEEAKRTDECGNLPKKTLLSDAGDRSINFFSKRKKMTRDDVVVLAPYLLSNRTQ